MDTRCPICGCATRALSECVRCTCAFCGIVRSTHNYDPSIYDKGYAETYVEYAESPTNTPLMLCRLGLVSRWLKPRGTLLDIGCGIGEFLRFAEEYYNCAGFEPNIEAASLAKQRINSLVSTHLRELENNSGAEVITLFDVLEHIQDPIAFLQELRDNFLAPGGVIVITTPNVVWVPVKNLKNWKHFKPREHLFLYTPGGLSRMLSGLGFSLTHTGFEESDIRPGNPNRDLMTCVVRKNT